jgi:hypothetical protein
MSSRPLICSSLHPRWLPLAAACLLGASSASAALITVSGSMTVTSAVHAEFRVGDVFDYSFTFDDTTVDSDSNTFNAQFGSGVSAVSLQRRGSNTGSWDPSGGTFDIANINFGINANSDAIFLQVRGTGFPTINSLGFFDLSLSFDWAGSTRDFLDNGSAQTFAQVVGTSPLNFATADETAFGSPFFGEIRNTYLFGSHQGFTVSVNGGGGGASVPEGAVFAPLSLGLGALLVGRGRRR